MKVSSDYFHPHVCAGVTGGIVSVFSASACFISIFKKKKKKREVDGEHVFQRDA